ncbi:RVP_2 domain-containing protein [Cephalotus follicularis]|uniref:RVP_2 domain-containing protein n=1 Tax=Cephalotus follicularis TaxID=3775 RepID=A0A1Q3DFC4_CEPFO|nr:RVP_2 domain-containing protein [Cephalotus follicularis]
MSNQCTRPKTGGQGGNGAQQQRTPARTYATTAEEVENPNDAVTGTFPVCSRSAYVLFDTGAMHSFVSLSFARYLSTPSHDLEIGLAVETPSGNTLVADKVYKSCDLILCDRMMLVDLVPLVILKFDVILGMDWLSANHASVDCFKKEVRFAIPEQLEFVCRSMEASEPLKIISSMQAKRLLERGCEGYLAYVMDINKEKIKIEELHVVKEFTDVFPKDLPGMPPDREVEFTIDVVPGTTPISKSPYRMAPTELKELKDQLQELLDKGFIRLSVSP